MKLEEIESTLESIAEILENSDSLRERLLGPTYSTELRVLSSKLLAVARAAKTSLSSRCWPEPYEAYKLSQSLRQALEDLEKE